VSPTAENGPSTKPTIRNGRDVLVFAVASFIAVILCRKLFGKRSDQTKLDQDDIIQY